ncbi:MAG TPA: orotate phosphoribosyltransferase [Bacillota bacterium]|nr:orotate phosphoribosyltransferase [Bacillota bacterium]
MGYKEEFIEFMVRSNVLRFGDFTAKSGRKTPYFINAGNYRTGAQIAKLGDFYAACIVENQIKEYDLLFGPAYKGIPLSVAAAIALFRNYQMDIPYSFNRKEAKDHGEGGVVVGYQPQDNDRVLIIEDVTTAGTSVRESFTLLKNIAKVNITTLVVSVDRMEKGTGSRSALQELQEDYGIRTQAIVNIRDIVNHLYQREIDGKILIDDEMKQRIEAYLAVYGS